MTKPVIQVQHVTKTVGERQLLRDITFDIHTQAMVSLIGPNGAGKSTLVKIILGLDAHYTGSVSILPGQRVQYIPQLSETDQYQLPVSVHEYLSIGTTPLYSGRRTTPSFETALEHVGVSPLVLAQPFVSLSGGERQRVAIARALLAEPTILVLDEPLAAVDYASRSGLYALIRHLQQDHAITVLLVSHDIDSVLPVSDRVLCLNTTLRTECHPTDFRQQESGHHPAIHHHC